MKQTKTHNRAGGTALHVQALVTNASDLKSTTETSEKSRLLHLSADFHTSSVTDRQARTHTCTHNETNLKRNQRYTCTF